MATSLSLIVWIDRRDVDASMASLPETQIIFGEKWTGSGMRLRLGVGFLPLVLLCYEFAGDGNFKKAEVK